MRLITRAVLVSVVVVFFATSSVFAGGMHLAGIGPKALAMGGAFRAVSDDYSAIFWNPAGLYQIDGKTLDFTYTGIYPSLKFQLNPNYPIAPFAKSGEISNTAMLYSVANLAATWDMKDWKAGIAIYAPAGLGATWDIFQEKPILGFADPLLGNPTGTNYPLTLKEGLPKDELQSFIGVLSIHPALSRQLNDQVSVGFGINFNYGMVNLKRVVMKNLGGGDMLGHQELDAKGWGVGLNAGILMKVSPQLRFGASLRYEMDISMSGTVDTKVYKPYNAQLASSIPDLNGDVIPMSQDVDFDLPRPLVAGAGIAFTPNDQLTLAADVEYTQWSVVDKIEAGDEELTFNWKNTVKVSVGAQYLVNEGLALRAGFYSDPSPAPDETLNPLLPDIARKNSVTAGFGLAFGKFWLNFAGEYILSNEREIPLTQGIIGLPGTYKSSIPSFDINLNYTF